MNVQELFLMAVRYERSGDWAGAAQRYDELLALEPTLATAHFNLALCLFRLGNYARAWREFEWRFEAGVAQKIAFDVPRWDGSRLDGETVFVYTESGLGDVLQFVRFTTEIKVRGGRVALVCPAELVPLLTNQAGADIIIPNGGWFPPFNLFAPLMSIPAILGVNGLSERVPYIVPDPQRLEIWRRALQPRFNVGVCWQGSSGYTEDARRSFRVQELSPLASVPGVSLISLQKGSGETEVLDCEFPIQYLGKDLDAGGAFMDTAAIMKSLDLVITCDSAIGHLAGALGVPVWVALPFVSDWRWIVGRDDSPWYPTMRLFRQTTLGEWGPVFQRMADELNQLVSAKG
jgi:hypothetical protein